MPKRPPTEKNPNGCTGPTTPEGKEASSKNALKHGCCSKILILPDEDPAEVRTNRRRRLTTSNSIRPTSRRRAWSKHSSSTIGLCAAKDVISLRLKPPQPPPLAPTRPPGSRTAASPGPHAALQNRRRACLLPFLSALQGLRKDIMNENIKLLKALRKDVSLQEEIDRLEASTQHSAGSRLTRLPNACPRRHSHIMLEAHVNQHSRTAAPNRTRCGACRSFACSCPPHKRSAVEQLQYSPARGACNRWPFNRSIERRSRTRSSVRSRPARLTVCEFFSFSLFPQFPVRDTNTATG